MNWWWDTFYKIMVDDDVSVWCDSMRCMAWRGMACRHKQMYRMPIINKQASKPAVRQAIKFANIRARTSTAQRIGETRYEKKIANYANYRTASFSSDCVCLCVCVCDWIWHAAQTMSFVHFNTVAICRIWLKLLYVLMLHTNTQPHLHRRIFTQTCLLVISIYFFCVLMMCCFSSSIRFSFAFILCNMW